MRIVIIAATLAMCGTRSYAETPAIKVMTFNIRADFNEGTPTNSAEAWLAISGDHRRDLVTAVIRQQDPDLLGVQEAYDNQIADLQLSLPGFAHYGVGRDDGVDRGEHCAIFFRSSRFTPRGHGTFWLSRDPELRGSIFPGAATARIASWIVLHDNASDGREYFVLNTHWDHVSQDARRHSAELLCKRIPMLAESRPVVVMGDLNADEDSAEINVLFAAKGTDGMHLRDGYREASPTRAADEATFHQFRGVRSGYRIDYILHNELVRTASVAIIHTDFAGRYPSDHFPIVSILHIVD